MFNDINNNHCRVQELFQRIDDAEDNEEDIWKLLACQGLISDEQFENLSKLDNIDIETIAYWKVLRLVGDTVLTNIFERIAYNVW